MKLSVRNIWYFESRISLPVPLFHTIDCTPNQRDLYAIRASPCAKNRSTMRAIGMFVLNASNENDQCLNIYHVIVQDMTVSINRIFWSTLSFLLIQGTKRLMIVKSF